MLPDRFLAKIETDQNDCWIWNAYRNASGYGVIGVGPRTMLSHRFAYECLVGPIPEGLQIDHLCRVRECQNPEHMELVTPEENSRRGRAGRPQAERTHCPRGHPYDEANTRHYRGRRHCRACDRLRDFLGRRRKQAA